MSVAERIGEKLKRAFDPAYLAIENESARHAGHAAMKSANPAILGESHFRVIIISSAFEGKSRVDRHRLVNEILAEELSAHIHALAIRAMTPGEAEASAKVR
jgi:BolA protein